MVIAIIIPAVAWFLASPELGQVFRVPTDFNSESKSSEDNSLSDEFEQYLIKRAYVFRGVGIASGAAVLFGIDQVRNEYLILCIMAIWLAGGLSGLALYNRKVRSA